MTVIIIFIISGLVIVVLLWAKKLSQTQEKSFFILEVISKGDIHIREIYHKALHFYAESKEGISFFFKKHVPIHLKNFLNKLMAFLKEKQEQYVSNMRNSRLLKKSDGISEFFKNMSEVEKGNGEINDVYEDTRQNNSVGLDSQNTKEKVK